MAKGSVKRKATPSSIRKKKAQQRIRKKIRQKIEKRKPDWRTAAAKVYLNKDSRGGAAAASPEQRRRARKAAGGAAHARGEEEEEGAEAGFSFRAPGEEEEDGEEVQSDVDEERQERLNQQNPLETQLFLKGLPLDTDEEELTSFFQTHFGQRVRRVLLVRNKLSKALAGTAFVHCGSAELATTIFEEAQRNARELAALDRQDLRAKTEGLSHHQAKRLAYKLRTDTTVARDPFLTLRDMKFTVLRVLSRSDAQEAVSSQVKKKKRTKAAADDPRHLYLLQEGLILRDTPAAKDLHPKYMQMIEDDYEARKQQLRNSNFFVSTTRLSVRNLPRTLTENDVRRLFAAPVREYLKTHKEDMDKERWGKYGPIKSVKLLRDTAGVSKGYGFIEFVNHNIALNALRATNNNPTLFGDRRRLMVSFAIENMDAVKKLERIKEAKKQREIRSAAARKRHAEERGELPNGSGGGNGSGNGGGGNSNNSKNQNGEGESGSGAAGGGRGGRGRSRSGAPKGGRKGGPRKAAAAAGAAAGAGAGAASGPGKTKRPRESGGGSGDGNSKGRPAKRQRTEA